MLSREEKRGSLSHSSSLAPLCASVNPPFASGHGAVWGIWRKPLSFVETQTPDALKRDEKPSGRS
jgi:hypothetical protein